MKIAVISDIHGNDIALRAVLSDAKRNGAEHLFVLGDLIGYYYHPKEILKLLADWPKDEIKGNHENMLADVRKGKFDINEIKKKYGTGIQFAINNLSNDEIDKLICLPYIRTVSYDGIKFLLCHGSPWNPNLYIYPNTNKVVFEKFKKYDVDYIFSGHTHRSYFCQNEKTIIINAGSVGQSRETGGIASWVIFNTTNRVVSFKATPYSVKNIIEEVKKIDPKMPYLHQILVRNRDIFK